MIQSMNPAQLNRDSDWFGNGMLALGRTYWAAGKLDKAEETYAEMLGSSILNPRFIPMAARYRAEVLKEAGRTNEALKAYRVLLEIEDIDEGVREQATAAIKELENGL